MNRLTNVHTPRNRVSATTGCGLLLSAYLTGMLLLGGCKAEEEEPVVVNTPRPAPVAAPPPVATVAVLHDELRIDQRIYLAEEFAPSSTEARRAVLEFFDAIARGNDRALASKLSALDRSELEEMVQSGQWKRATEDITRIEIQTGLSPLGDECALAIIESGMDYQPQLWYFKQVDEGTYVFDAAASPPEMMNRLSGSDWIAAWHDVLREEEAIANQGDVAVNIPQRNLDQGDVHHTGSGPGDEDEPGPGTPTTPTGPRPVPGG